MQQKQIARDIIFVPEVRPTTKVAYISIEVLTKSWSLSTLILPSYHQGQPGAHYQSPQRGGQYKLSRTQPQSLGAPRRHLAV
jgi:hypothetical protein